MTVMQSMRAGRPFTLSTGTAMVQPTVYQGPCVPKNDIPFSFCCFSSSLPARVSLRHSREITRVCSRRVTHRPNGAGDDNALPICGLRAKVRCRGWATLSEHKWSSFGERRGGIEQERFDGVDVLTDVSEAGFPTGPVLRGTVQVRVNIGPAGGCQHCEAFSESSNPLHRLPHIRGRGACLVGGVS